MSYGKDASIQIGVVNTKGRAEVHIGNIIHQTKDLNDLLETLDTAVNAPFNAYQRQHDPTCLPGTRVDLLQEIYNWAGGQDEPCIFWLSGLAGTGKSTVALTVAAKYSEKGSLGASFFFSRGGGDVGRAGKFVASIAVQLANNVPPLKSNICDAVTKRSNIASLSLRDQWERLVLRPLSELDSKDCHLPYILVVDALDECEDQDDVKGLLRVLANVRDLTTIKLLITSRPEPFIQQVFDEISEDEEVHHHRPLETVEESVICSDISVFIRHELQDIQKKKPRLPADWPGNKVIDELTQKSGRLFNYAAVACRYIRGPRRGTTTTTRSTRLEHILQDEGRGEEALDKM